MAFEKRTWLARIGTGLNKFIIGDKDENNKQTLTNSPDTVSQEGDVISAENLNDLEDRIEAGLNEKQNTLTFDDVPTSGSNNPVKSGGVYTGLAVKQDTLTFDDAPTSGSDNPVKSGGIYTAMTGLRLTKVWENNSPTSDFASQTITISDYDLNDFVIEFAPKKDDVSANVSDRSRILHHYKVPADMGTVTLQAMDSSRLLVSRSIVVSHDRYTTPRVTKFQLLSGAGYNLFTQDSYEDHNEYCVPIAIYKVT